MHTENLRPLMARRAWMLAPLAVAALHLIGRERPATPSVKEVLLDEAKALVAAGALVIDVRERAAYEARHIAGALLAPLKMLTAAIPLSMAEWRALPVIVYCGDGSTLGPRGTHALNQAGFTLAVNLKPGIQGWADAGLPIERGAGRSA